MNKSSQKLTSLHDASPEQLNQIAENTKERIYASITLLAVIVSLWQTAQHHSAMGAIAAIVGAVVALWAATLIAARMSHRAVHGRSIALHEYRHILFTSSGLLAPAVVPVILVLVSMTGLFSLKTALLTAMITILFALFLFSYVASRRIYESAWRQLFISLLEMSVGVGVIALKIFVGE